MAGIGTIVSIRRSNEYGGKYAGKLGIVKKLADNRVGVEFSDLKNPASGYGLFWFKKENVKPSFFDTPKHNDAIMPAALAKAFLNFTFGAPRASLGVKQVIFSGPKTSLWLHFSGKEGLGKNEKGDFQMSTIYIGERQSGKTTMLIEMSEKTGATIVVATYPMAKYIQLLAAQMGKKIPVPITVTNYIRLLASGGLCKSEKYLVDELQMMLSAMNVEAATVDCDCIEVLRGQQKEGL